MLAKSVKYDQSNARELLQSIFELIVKVLLLSLIQDADVPHLRQNFVQCKFLLVSFDQMRHL
jgi:hypothetical protein